MSAPPTGLSRTPPPAAESGGFPLSGWLAVGFLLWLILQFWLPGARARWKSRWVAWGPLLLVVASDISYLVVRPCRTLLATRRFRREIGGL